MEKPMILDASGYEKEFEFEEYLRTLGGDVSLVVFRVDDERKRLYKGKLHSVDVGDDIHELIKKKFGNGEFFIQAKIGNRLGKGMVIFVDKDETVKTQTGNNTALESKIDRLIEAMTVKNQPSEIEMLEKMKMYKELFGGNGGGSNSSLIKEIIQSYKDGLEIGKTISNPEPETEKKDNSNIWGNLLQVLPMLLQNRQSAPAYIPTEMNPPAQNYQQPAQQNTEEEEMKLKYMSLIHKIRKTAQVQNSEEKQKKISTLALEIVDFYEELLIYIDMVKDDNAINGLIQKYGISITEVEKETCKKIVNEVKEILKEETLDSDTSNS